jgi:hypothetical protein
MDKKCFHIYKGVEYESYTDLKEALIAEQERK